MSPQIAIQRLAVAHNEFTPLVLATYFHFQQIFFSQEIFTNYSNFGISAELINKNSLFLIADPHSQARVVL